MANRARVIYQSEALYAGTVDATGHHYSTSTDSFASRTTHATQAEVDAAVAGGADARTGIMQLRRVQSANYSFTVNRQDVNQFGQLARIDSVAIDPPTVTLDFSYYLTNGVNERILGFNVDGATSALANDVLLGTANETANPDGKNFFILTTPQGKDAVGNASAETEKSVIALGNGFVSNYSMEASVGGMPTASVTIDGLNLSSYTGTQAKDLPSINTQYGIPVTGQDFSLPDAISGVNGTDSDIDYGAEGVSCLRPGDITMSLGLEGRAGLFENLPHSEPEKDFDAGSAHIQSFSIDLPIGRSTIQRLGNPYGYTRATDFPVNISVSVSAILSDLKEGNVTDLLFNNEKHTLAFTLREPDQFGTGDIATIYTIKGAQLEGESFSSSIGDNKTVDLTFTAQVGGPEDTENGIFISGSKNALTIEDLFA